MKRLQVHDPLQPLPRMDLRLFHTRHPSPETYKASLRTLARSAGFKFRQKSSEMVTLGERAKPSWLIPSYGAPDELNQVGFHLLQRRYVDIHHMSLLLIIHADIPMQALVQSKVVERIFRGEIGRAEVVIAVGDENL